MNHDPTHACWFDLRHWTMVVPLSPADCVGQDEKSNMYQIPGRLQLKVAKNQIQTSL